MESWCRILLDGTARLGLRQDEQILIYEGDLFANPVATGQKLQVQEAEWLAPVEPRQLLGLWNNLHEAMEHGGNELPKSPLYFPKLPGSLNHHLGDIPAPGGYADKVIFEAELGVLAIIVFFILISLARGYLKELGVTTMIFVALFIITEFGVKYLPQLLERVYGFQQHV